MITFQHPEYFSTILAAGAAIFLGYFLLLCRKGRILNKFGGRLRLVKQGSRMPHPARETARAFLVVLVFLLFALSYWTGPSVRAVRRIPIYEQAEICFALDASRSSLARDVRFVDQDGRDRIASRFEFAKAIVASAKDIVGPDDAPCLIFFAGSAIVTVSVNTYRTYVDIGWQYILYDLGYADDYFVEYEIPQGSNFEAMILRALSSFSQSPTRKILVVITDGEPERGAETTGEARRETELAAVREKAKKEVAEFRQNRELAIQFLGTGDTLNASPIPKRTSKSGKALEYHTYISGPKKGEAVRTRPDPIFLLKAAKSLGGGYRPVKDLDDAKRELSSILKREKRVVAWETKEDTAEAWPYFVMAGLVLLFVVPFLKSP